MRARNVKTEKGLKNTSAAIIKKEIGDFFYFFDSHNISLGMLCRASIFLGENTVSKLMQYDDAMIVRGGTAKAIRDAISAYFLIYEVKQSGFSVSLDKNGRLVFSENISEQIKSDLWRLSANVCAWLKMTDFRKTENKPKQTLPKREPILHGQENDKMKTVIKELIKHVPREKLEDMILCGFSIS